ncbi:MAG: DNA-binding protein WhiA [Eubacteriales bacterium]|nr:DNA-binding protein WhiA [Eubacteriales bacterium]
MTFSYRLKSEISALNDALLDYIVSNELPEDSAYASWFEAESGETPEDFYNPEYVFYFALMAQAEFRGQRIRIKTSQADFAALMVKLARSIFRVELELTQQREYLILSTSSPGDYQRIIGRLERSFNFQSTRASLDIDLEDLMESDENAILQAVFLASGSMAEPSYHYQIELAIRRPAIVALVSSILQKKEIHFITHQRGRTKLLYLKGGDDIAHFLASCGAQSTLLEFEALRVEKGMRNAVNRAVNCDKANTRRLVQAAQEQIEAIRYLKERGIFQDLSEELQAAGDLRYDHPEYSLNELGAMMQPPLGKSGMNHRLQKLCRLYEVERREESNNGY